MREKKKRKRKKIKREIACTSVQLMPTQPRLLL